MFLLTEASTELPDITDIQNLEELKNTVQNTDPDKLKEYLNLILDWLVKKGLLVLLTLLFLFIASKLIKLLLGFLKKGLEKTGISSSVCGFLISLIKVLLYLILIITAASILGLQVTSLVAILGSAGVAIGLALQGSLSNLAGGVLILILKPFVVGDYIVENDKGCEGVVESIDIFYTKLLTVDNKLIVIPNGNLTSHSIVNVTSEKQRRLDISIGVSYDSNIKKVKEVLSSIANNNEFVLKDRPTDVFVEAFNDSSIGMGIRFWVPTEKYWAAKWYVNEKIKEEFDKAGIEIPYNQLDVEIKHE